MITNKQIVDRKFQYEISDRLSEVSEIRRLLKLAVEDLTNADSANSDLIANIFLISNILNPLARELSKRSEKYKNLLENYSNGLYILQAADYIKNESK